MRPTNGFPFDSYRFCSVGVAVVVLPAELLFDKSIQIKTKAMALARIIPAIRSRLTLA